MEPRLGELRQIEAAVNGRSKGCHPENLDGHPQFQGTETTRKLEPVIGKVELGEVMLGILEIFRQNPESLPQLGQVAYQNATNLKRLKQPLVRIERERVRQLQALEQFAAAL